MAATKKAVLAGINQYRYVSDLRGCVRDVEKFQALLTDSFGFKPQHIRTLLDADVIKQNLNEELQWLLKGAKAGDQLVFMFAGHGSQTADLDGDEPDGVDELLCLYDMNFDDEDSYLLDDEVYRFTRRLPEGANLTIVFDCCHSGTATRLLLAPSGSRSLAPNKTPLVDLETTLARASDQSVTRTLSLKEEGTQTLERLLEPRTVQEQRQTVLARFVEPPPQVLELLGRRGIRRSLHQPRGKDRRVMNHTFFAASHSTQTAADAYIDGDFHGAFSFYFCQAVRRGEGDDVQGLLREVRSALAQGRFSQVPQLEPDSASGPLLGGAVAAQPSKPAAVEKEPAATTQEKEVPAEEKLDQPLARQILARLDQIYDVLQRGAGQPLEERAGGGRALVYVHGICRHEAGYSRGWWNALRPHLRADLAAQLEHARHEVLWSHHVTAERALPLTAAPPEAIRAYEAREQELANYLRDVVEDRAQREALQELPPQDRDLRPLTAEPPLDRGLIQATGLNCIDDFTKYLMRNTVRREVQREFLDVVRPLLEAGAEIDVMSHSWGTVVAYESLRMLDDRDLSGRVLNLFTIGSALSIVPVQRLLETGDFARPRHVRRWVNLDARRDFVGGSLRSLGYGVDEEYLNLEPVGCRLFRDNPWCAHSSYFRAENAAVNRDIFARHMQG